jgi:hypothetical protein
MGARGESNRGLEANSLCSANKSFIPPLCRPAIRLPESIQSYGGADQASHCYAAEPQSHGNGLPRQNLCASWPQGRRTKSSSGPKLQEFSFRYLGGLDKSNDDCSKIFGLDMHTKHLSTGRSYNALRYRSGLV